MGLATINTNWQNGSYEADRNALILRWENVDLLNSDQNRSVYQDELSLAIGFGYDIRYDAAIHELARSPKRNNGTKFLYALPYGGKCFLKCAA